MYYMPGGFPQYVSQICFAVGRFGQLVLIWLSVSGAQVETAAESGGEDDGVADAAESEFDVSAAFMLLSCIEATNRLRSTNAPILTNIDLFIAFLLFLFF
jgi:hypothetical protein